MRGQLTGHAVGSRADFTRRPIVAGLAPPDPTSATRIRRGGPVCPPGADTWVGPYASRRYTDVDTVTNVAWSPADVQDAAGAP